jgi:hypothetical protein
MNYLLQMSLSKYFNVFYVYTFLIGITILLTPSLVVPTLVDSPQGFAGEIYCSVLHSQFMLFFLGVVSVYTAVFLSIERWLAVQYPFKYRATISSSKVKACVLFIWVFSLLTNAPHLTEMGTKKDLNTSSCQWKHKDYKTRQVVAFLEILLKFILPSVILVLVLVSFYRKFRSQNLLSSTRPERERQLLRMSAAISFVVLICWSPNQIYYLLYKFGVVKLGTKWHHCTVVLALSTSAVNPVIYYVTSTSYRRCLQMLLNKIFSKCKKRGHLSIYPLADMECSNTRRDVCTQQVFDGPFFTWNPHTINHIAHEHTPS